VGNRIRKDGSTFWVGIVMTPIQNAADCITHYLGGQGLAIARSIIVEKHGGSIDIHGCPGGGACFELRLPVSGRFVAKAA
jgi:K+-sensing histidine kinase KdpD